MKFLMEPSMAINVLDLYMYTEEKFQQNIILKNMHFLLLIIIILKTSSEINKSNSGLRLLRCNKLTLKFI